jgi:hypothetical protein
MAYGIVSDFTHSPVSINICKRPPTLTTISDPYSRFQPFIRIYKKIPNFPMDLIGSSLSFGRRSLGVCAMAFGSGDYLYCSHSICRRRFCSESALVKHYGSFHGRPTCETCGKKLKKSGQVSLLSLSLPARPTPLTPSSAPTAYVHVVGYKCLPRRLPRARLCFPLQRPRLWLWYREC